MQSLHGDVEFSFDQTPRRQRVATVEDGIEMANDAFGGLAHGGPMQEFADRPERKVKKRAPPRGLPPAPSVSRRRRGQGDERDLQMPQGRNAIAQFRLARR